MQLRKTDAKTTCEFNVDTTFGTFGITEVLYGEESTMLIIRKDEEFAVAHCLLYCCRGLYEWDNLIIEGETSYYTTDNGEFDEDKCKTELTQVLDFIRDCYNNDTIYDVVN